ncbi:spore germination protein [Clostridium sp. USBA 49]|uniref:glycosyl hydrolase family 18 protein n=1 Tax=Clostridium sp. USBA 49 TaxID=1881060 RepID=UPI00099A51FA|nr:glycosyl hydrolase family 18 protein [Clostridium sp. USBA 49]SKA86470.1 spore germination protein [Clostridium sp. USBA 49]
MIIHVVKPGESLYSISRLYNVPLDKIASYNELKDPNRLVIGQTLVIIEGVRKHVITPNQSFYTIASIYGLTIDELIAANPHIANPSWIYPGQIINIPSKTKKLGTIEVNGYAFPNIDMTVLKKTLPYLTYLSIFSHEVKENGSLRPINDTPLIEEARKANVAPLLVITNLLEGKGFSSDLAHTILSNENLQNTLLNNVIQTLKDKNYYGLDIDFEYIYPKDKELYNNFIEKAVNKLNPLGYFVTTALAPKVSENQKGVLYEAHDYSFHGKLVSHVILMTYEWGYTFGPPMAVAPLNAVRRVLDYAVTAIPKNKILMGIPNYGYDWTLPYKQGTSATTLSNVGAVNLAAKVGAVIQYDNISQSPYFNYYDSNGREHIVWFEDARSINAKLKLVNEFSLGGVSYWTIGQYFPQNWLVLSSLYDIKKVI